MRGVDRAPADLGSGVGITDEADLAVSLDQPLKISIEGGPGDILGAEAGGPGELARLPRVEATVVVCVEVCDKRVLESLGLCEAEMAGVRELG